MGTRSPKPKFDWRVLQEPPNLLSLLRVPLAGLVWTVAAEPLSFVALTALAGLTDLLDGMAARAIAEKTAPAPEVRSGGIGDWLDPVCDKIFIASAIAAAYVHHPFPGRWLVLLLFRDLAQLIALLVVTPALYRQSIRLDFRANLWGKATTVSQFGALFAALFVREALLPFALLSFSLGLTTVFRYISRAQRAVQMGSRRAPP